MLSTSFLIDGYMAAWIDKGRPPYGPSAQEAEALAKGWITHAPPVWRGCPPYALTPAGRAEAERCYARLTERSPFHRRRR